MARLDMRSALYGEKRLSDPQVLALRGAALHGLHCVRSGWGDSAETHRSGTVLALRRAGLVDVVAESIVATPRGHAVLRRIDQATSVVRINARSAS